MTLPLCDGIMLCLAFPKVGIFPLAVSFLVFLLVCYKSDQTAARKSISCPLCAKRLFNRLTILLETGRCPDCERPIVKSGPYRSLEVIRRRDRIRHTKLTVYISWGLVLVSGGLIGLGFLLANDSTSFDAVWMVSAISLISVWSYFRTWDRRLAVPATLSLFLFFVGSVIWVC